VCGWHKNQRLMQVGGKTDEVGWDSYRRCLEGGAIIATGHEHSYSRTHLLSAFDPIVVVDRTSPYTIEKGKTVGFVSGLGGHSIRVADKILEKDPWWASISTLERDADYGALFCSFHVDGRPELARCYYKDIRGRVIDRFELLSAVEPVAGFNRPPTASAGPDATQMVASGGSATFTLDGSGSMDPDGTIVSYEWREGTTLLGTGARLTRLFGAGAHTVSLTVTDDGGATDTDTVTIRVISAGGLDLTHYRWREAGARTIVAADVKLAAGTDDAEEDVMTGVVDVASTDLELTYDAARAREQLVGLRFANLPIPAGTNVAAAYIQFVADEVLAGATTLTFRSQPIADAPAFATTAKNISARLRSNEFVTWPGVPAWPTMGEAGPAQRTPDLTDLVQEVIERPGWAVGKPIVFIVEGPGRRAASSFDLATPAVGAAAPTLLLEYATGDRPAFAAGEDVGVEGVTAGTVLRLRMLVSNVGAMGRTVAYRLEVAPGPDCAGASWVPVTTTSAPFRLADAPLLADGVVTPNEGLTDPAGGTYVRGQFRDSVGTTAALTLGAGAFTEIEFAVTAAPAATPGQLLCFRVADAAGVVPLSYTRYPTATVAP
jgi:hypothetical protein